jgi:hypothetical protein
VGRGNIWRRSGIGADARVPHDLAAVIDAERVGYGIAI